MERRRQLGYQVLYLAALLVPATLVIHDVLSGPEPILEASGLPVAVMFITFIPIRLLRILQAFRPREVSALRDAQATVTLREGLADRVCSSLVAVGMLSVGGLPLLGRPGPDVPMFGNLILVAAGIFVVAHALFSRRAHLTLSPDGLDWSRITPNFMPWSDVRSSDVRRLLFSVIVEFEVKEAGQYFVKSIRKRASQRFGIFPPHFGTDAETLAEAIEIRRSANAF